MMLEKADILIKAREVRPDQLFIAGVPPSRMLNFSLLFFLLDTFAYSHRLRPGVNKESHGLEVAQLAGMLPSAVAVAYEAISRLNLKSDAWMSTTP
jgi:hypothetical protein